MTTKPNSSSKSSEAKEMTEDTAKASNKETGSSENQGAGAPSMLVERQFLRSSGIESLSGADRMNRKFSQPQIKVGVEVGATPLESPQGQSNISRFEVSLTAEARAVDPSSGSLPLFTARVVYCGIFILGNINDQQRPFVLGVEAPRILFPFVRHILADQTRESGFPPILLDNIDFVDMLRKRMSGQQKPQAATANAETMQESDNVDVSVSDAPSNGTQDNSESADAKTDDQPTIN